MAYLDLEKPATMASGITIKSLPEAERPRERLLLKGSNALSNSELLAIIIGKGAPQEPATRLAERIIHKFGDISDLSKLTIQELITIKGIGIAKACQISSCFEISRRISGVPLIKSKEYNSAIQIYNLVNPYLIDKEKEHFIIVSLDTRRRLIALDNISIGTINQTIVHPREVFKTAINRRASFIIIAHNHPSGDPTPSADDLAVTERLVNVSYTIGIPILDHIIVGQKQFLSLKEQEYIQEYIA